MIARASAAHGSCFARALAAERAPAAQGEQRGLERQGGGDRDERDEQPREAEGPDERHRHEEEEREPDRNREAGEDDRASRTRDRAHDGGVGRVALRELLAKPAHDEQ